ncbi:MAG TPA: NnrU family protein [Rhodocyclaceae bacterium]|nr:NnrU family protein [Rhodocyclaceae bacterium]
MTILILGLLIFLGTHSVRIVADDWRTRQIARIGLMPWKGAYALASLAGLVLIAWGYAQARLDPVVLWIPPLWGRHLASLLTLPAFILIAAAYVPGTRMRAAIGHPMLAGVKLWALAHLLSNGSLADVVLFGSFLVWAVVDFAAARRRDRAAGMQPQPGSLRGDAIAVVAGGVAWFVFARHLHAPLIGVQPFM